MLTKKYIAYLGIKEPATTAQVMVEVAGLEHTIRVAKERIANLKQALAIAELQKEELHVQKNAEPNSEEESVVQASDTEAEEGSEEPTAVS